MTMPQTAEYVTMLGGSMPSEMSSEELNQALKCLDEDLNGTASWLMQHAPESADRSTCECGAVHLSLVDPAIDDGRRSYLLRLLATPFGEIPRESLRRQYLYDTVKFGWDGLEQFAPESVAAIDHLGHRSTHQRDIPSADLAEIVAAIRRDLPGVVEMMEASAKQDGSGLRSYPVRPADMSSLDEWKTLIGRLMLAWSTPLKKFLQPHLLRNFGVVGGAVNCCAFPTEPLGRRSEEFASAIWSEQTKSQLTVDC